MRSLDDVRAEFDAVDFALVALIVKRQALAREAGAIKRAAGRAVVDVAREEAARGKREAAVAAHGASAEDAAVVERAFAVLIAASRDSQR